MKAYTDLEQSEKLAEILQPKTADMSYRFNFNSNVYESCTVLFKNWIPPTGKQVIPCWSLVALLEEMNRNCYKVSLHNDNDLTWTIEFNDGETYKYVNEDNPIDACYEMIVMLHEQNLI